MKVCLMHNLYSEQIDGGAEKTVANLAEAISVDGQEVFIISTRLPQAPAPTAKFKLYAVKSRFQSLSAWPTWWRFLWHLWSFLPNSRLSAIKKIIKTEKPDLVISHNLVGLHFGIGRLCRRLKIKHCHVLHDIQLLHPSGLIMLGQENIIDQAAAKLYAGVARYWLAKPDLVISPSRWLMTWHLKRAWFADCRQLILANPLAFKPVARQKTDDKKIFLFVGKLEQSKGIALLVEAFTSAQTYDKLNAELVVIGQGSQLKALAKAELPHINWLGVQDSATISTWMSRAVCLVVPSLCYENSPTVIWEAAAAGLPVIASNLGGNVELVPVDYLFQPEAEALREKLVWVVNTKNKLQAPVLSVPEPLTYWHSLQKEIAG